MQINVDPRLGMPLGSNATKFSNYDTYENEEELLKEREEKTWRLNKISMTNEDINEEIKRERALKLLEEEIRRINVRKL